MITKLLFLQSKTSPEKQMHLVVSELLCPIARTFSLSHLYEHNTDNSFLSLMLRDMKLLETTELQRNHIAYGQRWVLLKQEIRGLLINRWKQFRKQRQLKEFILQAGKRKWKAVSRQDEHVDGSCPPTLSYAGEEGGGGGGRRRKKKKIKTMKHIYTLSLSSAGMISTFGIYIFFCFSWQHNVLHVADSQKNILAVVYFEQTQRLWFFLSPSNNSYCDTNLVHQAQEKSKVFWLCLC